MPFVLPYRSKPAPTPATCLDWFLLNSRTKGTERRQTCITGKLPAVLKAGKILCSNQDGYHIDYGNAFNGSD
jgi:hypothetical protein